MVRYSISKYNSEFRDEYGCYAKEDWTSISDVGKFFNGIKLSMLMLEEKR